MTKVMEAYRLGVQLGSNLRARTGARGHYGSASTERSTKRFDRELNTRVECSRRATPAGTSTEMHASSFVSLRGTVSFVAARSRWSLCGWDDSARSMRYKSLRSIENAWMRHDEESETKMSSGMKSSTGSLKWICKRMLRRADGAAMIVVLEERIDAGFSEQMIT